MNIRDLYDKLVAAIADNMTLIAAIGIGLYPVAMAAMIMVFIPAFRGGLGEMVGWLICFNILNILIVLAGRIKDLTMSTATAVFLLCCELILAVVVTNMAFSRWPDAVTKFSITCQVVSLIFVQTSIWWTIRHQTEVLGLWKTWLAKLFSRQPAASSNAGSLNAPNGNNNNNNGGNTPPPALGP